MRVISIHAEQTFKPIEFTIIIETLEEVKALYALSQCNITIPNVVKEWDREANVDIIKNLLDSIIDEINEHDYTTPNN